MTIERWEDRLAKMDHSKGTTDKMRKAAMLGEIRELRVAVGARDRQLKKSIAKTILWMSHARRYQGELARERTLRMKGK